MFSSRSDADSTRNDESTLEGRVGRLSLGSSSTSRLPLIERLLLCLCWLLGGVVVVDRVGFPGFMVLLFFDD
jgi:hypothetical protein